MDMTPEREDQTASKEAALLKEKFQKMYAELVASGMSPNDAVAEALTRLHQTTTAPSTNAVTSTQETTNHDMETSEVVKEEEPQKLTLQLLQSNTWSTSAMQKLIYEAFSHSDQLNRICLPEHSRGEIQHAYGILVSNQTFANTLSIALHSWVNQSWANSKKWTQPSDLHQFWILFEHPLLFDPEYRQVVGGAAKLIYYLNDEMKAVIQARWATYSSDDLQRLLDIWHQYITLSLVGSELKMDMIFAVCDLLRILHDINETKKRFCTYQAFYNDAVNSELNLLTDYAKSAIFMVHKHQNMVHHRELSDLSFCDFPFLLDAASKSLILQFDAEYQQRTTVHQVIRNSLVSMDSIMPYLVLRVRREFVIPDALQQLVQVSSEQLKKPLKVKFIGEEGVDEGGVKKEFFQIIIRQLLDPNFAMFLEDDETHTLWFNPDSLESTMEFELIGILLGLAIYNGVILELHFPPIVYKKLVDEPLTLEDIEKSRPALGRGLRQLLEFNGDVESVFQRAFEVSYEVFGEIKTVELIPNGAQINVTNANRGEYVEKYIQYIATDSVVQQYGAFHRGFHLVCGGDVLSLFRYEELELLVCGSPELDFEALEQAAHYEDGYTIDSPAIRYFWQVVHQFSLEEKKQLLKFCTGSDRVPIRGLAEMTFVISRNGPDSNKLPTAHTCFNHLLLPDYSSVEKMKERLLIAISQSEGFGLL